MYCPYCGFQNDKENIYCLNCGKLLPGSTTAETKPFYMKNPWQLVLVVLLILGIITFIGFYLIKNSPEKETEVVTDQQNEVSNLNSETIDHQLSKTPISQTKISSLYTGYDENNSFAGPIPEDAIACLGRGLPTGGSISPDHKFFAIGSTKGLYLFDLETSKLVWYSQINSMIYSVKFSLDGNSISAFSQTNGNFYFWKTETGKIYQTLSVPKTNLYLMRLSPDRKTIAANYYDGDFTVWDVESGEQIHTLEGYDDYFGDFTYSPDSKYIIAAGLDQGIKMWDIENGKMIESFEDEKNFEFVRSSPNGEIIATSNFTDEIVFWDIKTMTKLGTIENDAIDFSSFYFSPDGNLILISNRTGEVNLTLWDVSLNTKIYSIDYPYYILGTEFTSKNSSLVFLLDQNGKINLEEIETGNVIKNLDSGLLLTVDSFILSTDRKTLYSILDYGTLLYVWDLPSGKVLEQQVLPFEQISATAFNSSSDKLAIAYEDGSLEIRELRTDNSKIFSEDNLSNITRLTFTYDGEEVISGHSDGSLSIWNLKSGNRRSIISADTGYLQKVEISQDNRILISSTFSNMIYVWEYDTGQFLYNVLSESGLNSQSCISPNNEYLAVFKSSSVLQLLDLDTGKQILTFEKPDFEFHNATFSLNSKIIAIRSKNKIFLFSTETGLEINCLEIESGKYHKAFTFLEDGKTLITGSNDGKIMIWDVTTGKLLQTLKGHSEWVTDIVLSSNEETLISGSWDGTILFWDISEYVN